MRERDLARTKKARHHRRIVVRRARAQDPAEAQSRRATLSSSAMAKAERVGDFVAWDPDKGAWPLSPQQLRILREVVPRATAEWLRGVLLPLISDREDDAGGAVSLRLLDWMVTNYSKSHHVVIDGNAVHQSYCDARNAYQCRSFDPFRRRLKVTFTLDGVQRHTTVGQLNFVMWASDHGVIEYAARHHAAIEHDMTARTTAVKSERERCAGRGEKRKRSALSSERRVLCRMRRPTAE